MMVAVIKQEHIKEVEPFQMLELLEQRVHLFSFEERNSFPRVGPITFTVTGLRACDFLVEDEEC